MWRKKYGTDDLSSRMMVVEVNDILNQRVSKTKPESVQDYDIIQNTVYKILVKKMLLMTCSAAAHSIPWWPVNIKPFIHTWHEVLAYTADKGQL